MLMTVFFNHAVHEVLPEQREIEAHKTTRRTYATTKLRTICDDTAMWCPSGPHTTPGGVVRPNFTPALLTEDVKLLNFVCLRMIVRT